MITLKNKFIFLFLFSFFCVNNVFGAECEYKGQIEQCSKANISGSTKSIEDFVCIMGNYEKIAYQVILDMEFGKIDDKMDQYLEGLEKNKNTYFGIGAQKNYIDGINDIHSVGKDFKNKYINLCGESIIKKVIACSINKKTTNSEAKKIFSNKGSSCVKLVDKKISIFKDVAFGVLMMNKQQVNADDKKTYDKGQRLNYDHLLEIMMINLGYIERIWQKWPSKLANPH